MFLYFLFANLGRITCNCPRQIPVTVGSLVWFCFLSWPYKQGFIIYPDRTNQGLYCFSWQEINILAEWHDGSLLRYSQQRKRQVLRMDSNRKQKYQFTDNCHQNLPKNGKLKISEFSFSTLLELNFTYIVYVNYVSLGKKETRTYLKSPQILPGFCWRKKQPFPAKTHTKTINQGKNIRAQKFSRNFEKDINILNARSIKEIRQLKTCGEQLARPAAAGDNSTC